MRPAFSLVLAIALYAGDVTLPKRWTAKPPVSAQLARGDARSPVYLWSMAEGAGNKLYNLASPPFPATFNSATPSWVPGLDGPAVRFTGAASSSAAVTNLTRFAPVSVAAWVRPRATPQGSQFTRLVDCGYNQWFYLGTDLAATHFQFIGGDGTTANIVGTTAFAVDRWYLIAGTLASSGAAVLYVNGLPEGSFTFGTFAGAFSGNCRFAELTTGGFAFNGDLAMVAIYNRVLTAGELLELYANSYRHFAPQMPMARFWAAPATAAARRRNVIVASEPVPGTYQERLDVPAGLGSADNFRR